jgi:phospholipase C
LADRAHAANPGPAAALTPIQHIVICAEENRSFDHYYGFASWIGSYGVPAGYTQPDGSGGTVAPYHFTSLSTSDVPHSWSAMHSEYDGGRMDGFYTTGGINMLGYYTAQDPMPLSLGLRRSRALHSRATPSSITDSGGMQNNPSG